MTLTYFIYQQGFQFRNMGYASAVSVIFFIIVVGLSMGIKKVTKAKQECMYETQKNYNHLHCKYDTVIAVSVSFDLDDSIRV